jgi:hypothetical protein
VPEDDQSRSTGGVRPKRHQLDPHHLRVRGHQIDPAPIEAAIRTYRGILDAAVTAVGTGMSRRLVAYLVLKPGLERIDVEGPLDAYLREQGLKPWHRPSAYAHARKLPRYPDGTIRRRGLSKFFGDGRRFLVKVVRWPADMHKPITRTIANPVNVFRFEGVVSLPPKRETEIAAVRLTVSHRVPGGKPKYCTFLVYKGPLARRAEALTIGQHVIVVGEMRHRRALAAVDFAVVKDGKVGRAELPDPITLVSMDHLAGSA